MAPSTPPPPSRVVLAAFTIASTASLVMSPRTSFSRGSAMLRFMNQANTAGVLVKRAGVFHRARVAVEGKGFHVRMRLAPFGKGSADATFSGHVEAGGKFADVVENQEAAGREDSIPKIELGEGRPILMRAVDENHFGIAAEIF